MSTFTPAKGLEQVARGGDLGTWDTPTNSNWAVVDAALGQVATIPLNNSNVVLSTPQYQSNLITFNSTLTASVSITFPTSFTGFYSVQNLCTGIGSFVITLQTTAAGGQLICAPPGEIVDVFNDGTNLKYRNLGRIGEYMDIAVPAVAVPSWIASCTVPPYLHCGGGTFSAATYPVLNVILGGNTLPDSRGRTRYSFDNGTGRITSVIGGPNTVGSGGGDQFLQQHLHNNTVTINDPSHVHGGAQTSIGNKFQGGLNPIADTAANTAAAFTGITATHNAANTGSGSAQNMPPLYIGGLTFIRAG